MINRIFWLILGFPPYKIFSSIWLVDFFSPACYTAVGFFLVFGFWFGVSPVSKWFNENRKTARSKNLVAVAVFLSHYQVVVLAEKQKRPTFVWLSNTKTPPIITIITGIYWYYIAAATFYIHTNNIHTTYTLIIFQHVLPATRLIY